MYGYDETSRQRVKRDPNDPAKLLLEPVAGAAGTRLSAGIRAGRSDSAAVGRAGSPPAFPITGRSG